MITLDTVPTGGKARIVRIVGGRGVIYRLYQMGLTPGVIVEVVANYGHGPIVVRVMGIETAIGRGIARKIFVEPI